MIIAVGIDIDGTKILERTSFNKAYLEAIKRNRPCWSGKRDLNPRPLPWQGNALPTELFPQHYHKITILKIFVNENSHETMIA